MERRRRRNRGVGRVEGDRILFLFRKRRGGYRRMVRSVERYRGKEKGGGLFPCSKRGVETPPPVFNVLCPRIYPRPTWDGEGALHPTAVIFITLLATATSTLLSVKWLLNESLWNEAPLPRRSPTSLLSAGSFVWKFSGCWLVVI